MKRINLLFLAMTFFISGNTLYAQNRFQFGLQAGAGITKFASYKGSQLDKEIDPFYYGVAKNYVIPSFNLNLYLAYKINNQFNIVLEPGLIRKGAMNKMIFQVNSEPVNMQTQLDYIQLPLSLEYKIIDKLYLTLGPEFSYLASAHFSSKAGRYKVTEIYKDNRFDFGMQGGAYYEILSNLDLGVKGGQSLKNIDEIMLYNNEGALMEKLRSKNSYLNFFVRYKF